MTVCQISVGKKKTNKKKNKKQTNKKTTSLLIFIQVEKINSKGGKLKELAHRKKKKKKEKAKKEGLTMRLPILSYNQADLSKLCGQIVFKK